MGNERVIFSNRFDRPTLEQIEEEMKNKNYDDNENLMSADEFLEFMKQNRRTVPNEKRIANKDKFIWAVRELSETYEIDADLKEDDDGYTAFLYPIFAVLIGTGLRVGEATGLRWCDIDLEEGIIDVNHTLVYYDHRTEGSKRGCYFNINTTKTPAGKRQVPMLDFVKEAFLMEKERQELLDIHCEAVVDGYTDFIFLNRFGQPQHQATLNKAIRRIIRDCNDEQLLKDENAKILLPHFSCHSLRHTFTTRMCEAGVNVKVIQDTLGHKDISTTLNIYTDVTKELRRSEFEGLDSYFKNEYNKAANI